MRSFLVVLLLTAAVIAPNHAQTVTPGGIVNAASYQAPDGAWVTHFDFRNQPGDQYSGCLVCSVPH